MHIGVIITGTVTINFVGVEGGMGESPTPNLLATI